VVLERDSDKVEDGGSIPPRSTMELKEKYTFDDLLLVPKKSNIRSIGNEVLTHTSIGTWELLVPVVSAAMSTVTGTRMQQELLKLGCLGIHYRYSNGRQTKEQQLQMLMLGAMNGPVAVAPSMGADLISVLVDELVDRGYVREGITLAIDVAHGHRQGVLDFAKFLKSLKVTVWSGNIVTVDAAKDYWNILDPLTDALKIGIGPGAACTTRVVSGCGYPQASAIHEIYTSQYNNGTAIIADGGIKSSGDIVKALALGADAVIIGRLFAGTTEAPGEHFSDMHGDDWKVFEGMASESALQGAGKTVRVEGVSGTVPYVGAVEHVIKVLQDGISTGLAYTGSRNIDELRINAEFIKQTYAGILEGQPRI
jgi:IMP dehydrogenase